MVVICPNCGREIFSDPDSCVMCGWRRDAREPREGRGKKGVDRRRAPTTQRPPSPQYPRERDESRYRRATEREPDYREPPRKDYMDRGRRGYRTEEKRDYRREPREERGIERGYTEGYTQRRSMDYPKRGDQRPYYDERRRPGYQERLPKERPSPRNGYDVGREPAQDMREREYAKTDRNYCPNCGSEIFTDPDNCVLCGWSRTQEGRRASGVDEQRRAYPKERTREYQERTYPKERTREYQERASQEMMDQGARRESMPRYPPEGWERRIEQRTRGRAAPQKGERRSWYRPETEARKPIKEGTRDRFTCENCGNPSLQFFADGLGRCPGCGYRFRFSARPTTIRSKQKHKQFICSNCDGKNLQFFFDGSGICPHCRREFRWRK